MFNGQPVRGGVVSVVTSRLVVSCRRCEALLSSLDEVGYIMIMFLTANFIFASMGVIFFGKTDPMHFDGLQRAMMAVWQIETLDGWEVMLYINMCATARLPPRRDGVSTAVPHHQRTFRVFPTTSVSTVFPTTSAATVLPTTTTSAATVLPTTSALSAYLTTSAATVFPTTSAATVLPTTSAATVLPTTSGLTVCPTTSAPHESALLYDAPWAESDLTTESLS